MAGGEKKRAIPADFAGFRADGRRRPSGIGRDARILKNAPHGSGEASGRVPQLRGAAYSNSPIVIGENLSAFIVRLITVMPGFVWTRRTL